MMNFLDLASDMVKKIFRIFEQNINIYAFGDEMNQLITEINARPELMPYLQLLINNLVYKIF